VKKTQKKKRHKTRDNYKHIWNYKTLRYNPKRMPGLMGVPIFKTHPFLLFFLLSMMCSQRREKKLKNKKSEQVFMLAKAPWPLVLLELGHQLWALIPLKPHGQGLNPTPKYIPS
jgi:hypothetical protein